MELMDSMLRVDMKQTNVLKIGFFIEREAFDALIPIGKEWKGQSDPHTLAWLK